mgnify:FL=1
MAVIRGPFYALTVDRLTDHVQRTVDRCFTGVRCAFRRLIGPRKTKTDPRKKKHLASKNGSCVAQHGASRIDTQGTQMKWNS